MGHDASKVLMGATGSNIKEVSNHKGTVAAGLAVRLKSDDTLSLSSSDGQWLGVSLGGDLSNAGYTAICRKGIRVPVQVGSGLTPVIGAAVTFSNTTGEASGSGTASSAVFASLVMENGGVMEDGTLVDVAYVDFPGGL
jgi:hypothetical protein